MTIKKLSKDSHLDSDICMYVENFNNDNSSIILLYFNDFNETLL